MPSSAGWARAGLQEGCYCLGGAACICERHRACSYKHKAGVVSLISLRVQLRELGSSHAAAALHRWLDLSETAKDLVMGMLEYDPKKRLTAKEVASLLPLWQSSDCALSQKIWWRVLTQYFTQYLTARPSLW